MLKAHLKILTLYVGASSKQRGGGCLFVVVLLSYSLYFAAKAPWSNILTLLSFIVSSNMTLICLIANTADSDETPRSRSEASNPRLHCFANVPYMIGINGYTTKITAYDESLIACSN